ncbi:holin family protein [Oceanospirillaceae bacterium]|nr:holin family protein [Oceanospirillaceae bacterium]
MASLNPLAGIAGSVMEGLDDLFTSDEEKANATLRLTELLQKPHNLQAMANIEGAKHSSVFVAGWRPAIGWVCAIGLGYQFLILPFAGLINAFYALPAELPAIQAAELSTLVMSLLGLGGLRSYEKAKGITK